MPTLIDTQTTAPVELDDSSDTLLMTSSGSIIVQNGGTAITSDNTNQKITIDGLIYSQSPSSSTTVMDAKFPVPVAPCHAAAGLCSRKTIVNQPNTQAFRRD